MTFCLVSMKNLLFSLTSVLKKGSTLKFGCCLSCRRRAKKKTLSASFCGCFQFCNSKTLPMLRQNRANYLPPASAGKNCSKTCKLSCAVYPHRTELNASIASFRRR